MLERMRDGHRLVLLDWLKGRVDPDLLDWLTATADAAADMDEDRLERALAVAGRKVGKVSLGLSDAELGRASTVRPGWVPSEWSLPDAALALVLSAAAGRVDGFGARFRRLCQTADLASLIGLYRATPVLPYDEDVDWQLGEGLRTSIGAIFEAIAHHNPVPTEKFSEHRWNHMVLKALFVDASLQPIVGLDKRRNSALAATLVDHVHERRAAGRAVNFHVWRCIAPFAEGATLKEILPLAESSDALERQVAALFLSESPDPGVGAMLNSLSDERADIASGALTWATIPG